MMTANEGKSVLEAMAKGIMEHKSEKATRPLTPLVGEQATIPAPKPVWATEDFFRVVETAQTQAQALSKTLDLLLTEWQLDPSGYQAVGPVIQTPLKQQEQEEAVQKAVEKAADADIKARKKREAAVEDDEDKAEIEDLAERMLRLQREAEAEVFQPKPVEEPVGPIETTWTCPEHHKVTERISPRRQRKFGACPVPGCTEFERL